MRRIVAKTLCAVALLVGGLSGYTASKAPSPPDGDSGPVPSCYCAGKIPEQCKTFCEAQ